jgi:hypothetical protein
VKRSNPFEKWRTRAKKPKVELDREPNPAPDVPQPVELKDELDQEPNLDFPAIDDIIEEEPAMPLQSENVSEETFDAEEDDVKLEIDSQKFEGETFFQRPLKPEKRNTLPCSLNRSWRLKKTFETEVSQMKRREIS